jgi:hypothetical protein
MRTDKETLDLFWIPYHSLKANSEDWNLSQGYSYNENHELFTEIHTLKPMIQDEYDILISLIINHPLGINENASSYGIDQLRHATYVKPIEDIIKILDPINNRRKIIHCTDGKSSIMFYNNITKNYIYFTIQKNSDYLNT